MPRASCWSVSAQPRARTSRSSASRSLRSWASRAGSRPDRVGSASTGVELVGASARPAAPCRATSAGPGTGCRSAPTARRSSGPPPGRRRRCRSRRAARSSRTRRSSPTARSQVRAGDVPQPLRPDVRRAELEHARGEGVARARPRARSRARLERQQDPARGRPGQPGRGRHVAQRDRLATRREGGDHLEPAGQRLDEVGAGPGAAAWPQRATSGDSVDTLLTAGARVSLSHLNDRRADSASDVRAGRGSASMADQGARPPVVLRGATVLVMDDAKRC